MDDLVEQFYSAEKPVEVIAEGILDESGIFNEVHLTEPTADLNIIINNNSEEWTSLPGFNELKQLLGSEVNAKIVWTSFEHHENSITEQSRKVLVHSFIYKKKTELLKDYIKGQPFNNWIVDKKEFEDFSNTIVRLFPGESSETYYTPFRVESGIIKPKSLSRRESSEISDQSIFIIQSTERDKLNYLVTHSDDVEKVKKYWIATNEIRIDFEILHSSKTNLFFEKWQIVQGHLIKLLRETKLSEADKAYIGILIKLSSDQQCAVILYIFFSFVFKSSFSKWKTS